MGAPVGQPPMEQWIEVPNEASMHVMRSFLARNAFFPENPTGFVLRFHPRFVYLQPFALAMLAAWGSYWRDRRVVLRCENLRAAGVDYAWRMGLFQFLGVQYQPRREVHEEAGRFIPLRRIERGQDVAAFLAEIAPLLHRPEHVQAVQYCLSETIRNVLEHAGQVPAYVCAQYYRDAHRVSIGVADCGVGVLGSLRRTHNFATHAEAVLGALRPGITGAPPGVYGSAENAGVGLFFTKSIAKASRQYFAIVSGDAGFRLRRAGRGEAFRLYANPEIDRHDLFKGLPVWNGTVVAVDIGVGHIRSFEATMNAIRAAISPRRPRVNPPKVRFK